MIGWRAFYADGETYSSDATSWSALPADGLVGAVVFLDESYREIVQTCDWWWMDPEGVIRGVPTHHKWGQWAPRPDAPDEMVKRGEGVSDERWTEIQDQMMAAKWQ